MSFGETFLQPKKLDGNPPVLLQQDQPIKIPHPYAIIAGKDSYLELSQGNKDQKSIIRLGKSTALEFREENTIYLFQGSCLICHRSNQQWNIQSENSQFSIRGEGTWMLEATPIGFKVIILEGKLTFVEDKTPQRFKPGDLILVSDLEGKISQDLEIELPLLLGTSRLLNHFPELLPSHSRLISAAQVQAMRMKKKYDAMIGDISEDRKLKIWELKKQEEK